MWNLPFCAACWADREGPCTDPSCYNYTPSEPSDFSDSNDQNATTSKYMNNNQNSQKPLTVAEQNAWFYSLKPAEQRVQIAKDVLAQLASAKRLISMTQGVYFSLEVPREVVDQLEKDTTRRTFDLQEVLNECDAEACECCAKGAIFAVKALNYNRARFDKDEFGYNSFALSDAEVEKGMLDIFSRVQLDLIENAFEASMINYGEGRNELKHQRATVMYFDADDSEDRMKLIMQNIIDNDGEFVVPTYQAMTKEQRAEWRENYGD